MYQTEVKECSSNTLFNILWRRDSIWVNVDLDEFFF